MAGLSACLCLGKHRMTCQEIWPFVVCLAKLTNWDQVLKPTRNGRSMEEKLGPWEETWVIVGKLIHH